MSVRPKPGYGRQAGFPNGVTQPSARLLRTRSAFTAQAQWTLKVRVCEDMRFMIIFQTKVNTSDLSWQEMQ